MKNKEKIKIILDTDLYNECDDQFALTYVLKSLDVFDLKAITIAPYSNKICSVKNGLDLSFNEAIKICKWLGFDYKNKVFKGCGDYLVNGYDAENEAVDKIIDIALKNDKVYILAIGALTNLALAIKKEPKIIDKISIIWLGGQSLLQDKNDDYNFKQDIKAVKIVFESNVDLTVIPCKNVASNLLTSIYELKHHLKNDELSKYLIERFSYDEYYGSQERRVVWDISVVAFMINKDWFEYKLMTRPEISEQGCYVFNEKGKEMTMVTYLNSIEIFKDLFTRLKN